MVNEEDWHDTIGHECIYTVSFKAIQDKCHAHHIRYMSVCVGGGGGGGLTIHNATRTY